MYKILQTNENQVLYKIEENGKTIENIFPMKVNGSSMEYLAGVTISTGNYIRTDTALPTGTKIIVFYDLKNTVIEKDILSSITQDINIIKMALKERITASELNLYIEKLRQF
jgi:hypothetical protein